MILYGVSLFLPAFLYVAPQQGNPSSSGFYALVFGVAGHISWLANPLLVLAWIGLGKKRGTLAACLAIAALLIACTFMRSGQQLAGGSAGTYAYEILSGYYVWIASIVVCVLAGMIQGRENLSTV